MAKHRTSKNPLRWLPVATLAGLALAGGVSVSAHGSHSTLSYARASVPVSVPARIPARKPVLRVQAPDTAVTLTYTVKPGDSLWGIARTHCGAGSDYPALEKANHVSSIIYSGEKITLSC